MQAGRLPNWRSAMEHPQPFVRTLCIVAIVALIGFELWSAITAQMNASNLPHAQSKAATSGNTANIEQITGADLFGHAASENANLPQTNLQITLRAAFAASDPKAASAVIESSDGRTQVVKVGGAIDSSASLQSVYSNRVVLSRNGVLETLYFPVSQETAAVNTAPPNDIGSAAADVGTGASAEEIKRAAILQRLEELRARGPR